MVSQWTQTTKFPFFKKRVCITYIAVVIQTSSGFIFNSIYSVFFSYKKYKEKPLLTFKIKVVYFHDLKLQSVRIGTNEKQMLPRFAVSDSIYLRTAPDTSLIRYQI